MKTGRPEYKIPSPSTVSRDVRRVFAKCRARIAKMLRVRSCPCDKVARWLTSVQDFDGELNFTFDAWTSPNHKALLAFAVHLHHEGEPLTFILDVVEVAESHTGEALAKAFEATLREFEIDDKVSTSAQHNMRVTHLCQILALTSDNAYPNDTMAETLGKSLPSFDGMNARGRCFDHIVNLCAKSVLRPFDVEKKKAGEALSAAEEAVQALLEDVDLYSAGLDLPAGEDAGEDDDGEGFVDEREEMDEEERESLEESIAPVKLVLTKARRGCESQFTHLLTDRRTLQIRTIAYKILHSSTILLPAWYDIVEKHELPCRVLPRDVRTRWNSTFHMLEVALQYKDAIEDITSEKKFGLREYEMDEEEWTMAEQLRNVLKVRPITAVTITLHVTRTDHARVIVRRLSLAFCLRPPVRLTFC